MNYEEHRRILIEYLKVKVDVGDWHGVSDAANDLRVLEAAPPVGMSPEERSRAAFDRVAERMAYEERRPHESRFQEAKIVYVDDLPGHRAANSVDSWWKRLLSWLRITN
jgi:hypothetical protein